MNSSQEKVWSDKYSCLMDPCPYCKGPHFWQQCQYIPEGELCAPSLSCEFCGGLWFGCGRCCYPIPKSSYDDSSNSCSFDSTDSCRKLLDEYEERTRRITYEMAHFVGKRVELIHDVKMIFLQIHNLNNELNAKVVAFDAQQSNYELCYIEKILVSQIEEVKQEEALCNLIFLGDDISEKYESGHDTFGVSLKDGRIGPHSNHFSTLCLDDDMSFEPFELMEESEDEEQESYILYFTPEKRKSSMPHFRAKKSYMHNSLLGSSVFVPPPYERSEKIDAKLGVQFISSRWREKLRVTCIVP